MGVSRELFEILEFAKYRSRRLSPHSGPTLRTLDECMPQELVTLRSLTLLSPFSGNVCFRIPVLHVVCLRFRLLFSKSGHCLRSPRESLGQHRAGCCRCQRQQIVTSAKCHRRLRTQFQCCFEGLRSMLELQRSETLSVGNDRADDLQLPVAGA